MLLSLSFWALRNILKWNCYLISLPWDCKIIVDMLSPNIGIVKRGMVACLSSPSCPSQFSEVCPHSPGNESFSFCFPQVTSCHRINFLNKWCKEMLSLLIYMVTYCFPLLLLKLHRLAGWRVPYLLWRAPTWAKRALAWARREPSLAGGAPSVLGRAPSWAKRTFLCQKHVFADGRGAVSA